MSATSLVSVCDQINTATFVVEEVSIDIPSTLYVAKDVVKDKLAGVFSKVKLLAKVGLVLAFSQALIISLVTASAVELQAITPTLTSANLVLLTFALKLTETVSPIIS